MKTKGLLLLLFVLLFTINNMHAKVWRVSARSGIDADFTTVSGAVSSSLVQAGDTIYIEAGDTDYGDITIAKKLIIIGTGYFLTENSETQADLQTPLLGRVVFSAGSEGSVIKGCKIERISVYTSDIIIENNYLIGQSSSYDIIYITSDINNIIIKKNFIQEIHSSRYCIYNDGNNLNIQIKNNAILQSSNSGVALTLNTGVIENNFIYGHFLLSNVEFHNNIVDTENSSFSKLNNSNYTHNICNYNQCGTNDGNQANVSMYDVFVNFSTSITTRDDNDFILKSGSPAIAAGIGGIDCGIFGGADPYILSGMPDIPAIYYYNQTVDNASQTLNITIKAKSH